MRQNINFQKWLGNLHLTYGSGLMQLTHLRIYVEHVKHDW